MATVVKKCSRLSMPRNAKIVIRKYLVVYKEADDRDMGVTNLMGLPLRRMSVPSKVTIAVSKCITKTS